MRCGFVFLLLPYRFILPVCLFTCVLFSCVLVYLFTCLLAYTIKRWCLIKNTDISHEEAQNCSVFNEIPPSGCRSLRKAQVRLANVGVQREADHLCKVKFNSFTPETSAVAKASQISYRQNNDRARERRS